LKNEPKVFIHSLKAVDGFNCRWTLIVDAYGRGERKEDAEPLDPMCEFFTKNEIGGDGSPNHDCRLPHDTGPHHALRLERLHEEDKDYQPSNNTKGSMVVLPVLGVPLEMGVSEEFGGRHEQHIHDTHPLYFHRKYFQERLQMVDVPYVASWISWLSDWGRAPSRLTREFIVRILIENPLEFRVAILNYQIKELMLKYI
jgi:hypothetical protein